MGTLPLGDFELLVMLAVLQEGADAYSLTIRERIESGSGARVSRGALYVTLDRLTEKGFLESWKGRPDVRRGGRDRRFYRATPEGRAAVRRCRHTYEEMWAGLDGVLEGA